MLSKTFEAVEYQLPCSNCAQARTFKQFKGVNYKLISKQEYLVQSVIPIWSTKGHSRHSIFFPKAV